MRIETMGWLRNVMGWQAPEGIEPTGIVHPVPEPSVWALMALGVALVLLVTRR